MRPDTLSLSRGDRDRNGDELSIDLEDLGGWFPERENDKDGGG